MVWRWRMPGKLSAGAGYLYYALTKNYVCHVEALYPGIRGDGCCLDHAYIFTTYEEVMSY